MTAETLAGDFLVWSLVVSLSLAMLSSAGWVLVVMYVTAADLLRNRRR